MPEAIKRCKDCRWLRPNNGAPILCCRPTEQIDFVEGGFLPRRNYAQDERIGTSGCVREAREYCGPEANFFEALV